MKTGDSEVTKKLIQIGIFMVMLVYISSGLFMVIENFSPDNLNEFYTFHKCFYFIAVTVSTVGYGDYFPQTDLGKIFILIMILYVLAISLPQQMNEIIRLVSLKSFYERTQYVKNPEMTHIVVTGQVTLSAFNNVAAELFHPEHGSAADIHVVLLQPLEPTI